jgi:hypothetical protein
MKKEKNKTLIARPGQIRPNRGPLGQPPSGPVALATPLTLSMTRGAHPQSSSSWACPCALPLPTACVSPDRRAARPPRSHSASLQLMMPWTAVSLSPSPSCSLLSLPCFAVASCPTRLAEARHHAPASLECRRSLRRPRPDRPHPQLRPWPRPSRPSLLVESLRVSKSSKVEEDDFAFQPLVLYKTNSEKSSSETIKKRP